MNEFNYDAELEAILSEFGAGTDKGADAGTAEEHAVNGDLDATKIVRPLQIFPDPDPGEASAIFRPVTGIPIERKISAGRAPDWPEGTHTDNNEPTHMFDPPKEFDGHYPPARRQTESGVAPGETSAIFRPLTTPPEESVKKQRKREYPEETKPERKPRQTYDKKDGGNSGVPGGRHVLLSFLAFLCSLALLFLVATGVHFGSLTQSGTAQTKGRLNSISALNTASNNMKADIMSGLAAIRKIYTIPEGERVAPRPDSMCYGVTSIDNLQPVFDAIEKARNFGLLEDQDVIFSKDVSFYHDPGIDSDIQFYCDETILVICWKELIENRICSCVEVKIADASQFRRKLCEDTYDSSVYLFASDLARQTNAVVAMNSDYYAFRNLGITVYDRTLYRFNEFTYSGFNQAFNSIDTLMIDSNGDFIFFKTGQPSTREDMENYIRDNNILFSIAFGPVLVENGEALVCNSYPCGEINDEYSRAGFAQYDKLHYLYMAVSHADAADSVHPRCTVNQFATYMQSKHVDKAYCFDGGQTGEVVFNGKPYNHIDYGNERTVSDIIYFATALPEEVRG